MNSFAFLNFSFDLDKPRGFFAKLFNKEQPLQVEALKNVRSAQGKTIEGMFLSAKLGAQQQADLCFEKVLEAAELAQRSGVKVLGVERCPVDFEGRASSINKRMRLALSDGNLFTAWSVYEAVYRVAKQRGLDLKGKRLVILGALSSLGRICAKKFSGSVYNTVICDTDLEALIKFREEILALNPCSVTVEPQVNKAIKGADIIISIDEGLEMFLQPQDFQNSSIICDVSISKELAKRQDLPSGLSVINGGLIRMPYSEDIISASLAQAMLLTFEEKFNHAFGDTPNLDKVEDIADIAVRHGFEVWVPQAPVM
ncbi:MAG: hypothetical protein PHT31_02560 [Candidatus Omnitrophica bacterium]|nr:hypothetical protein [Candidatus Omnitrophota bacterium]